MGYGEDLSEVELAAHDLPRDAVGDEVWLRLLRQLVVVVGHEPRRWIEVGVGTGAVAGRLTGIGVAVVGVDLNPSMLRRAEDRYLGLAGRLMVGDAEVLPAANGAFDVVVIANVLHLCGGWKSALTEAIRVLRGGGWLVHSGGGGTGRSSLGAKFREFLGPHPPPPGATSTEEILDELAQLGLADGPVLSEPATISQTAAEFIDRLEHNVFAWHPEVTDAQRRMAGSRTRRWAQEMGVDLDSASTHPTHLGFHTFRKPS